MVICGRKTLDFDESYFAEQAAFANQPACTGIVEARTITANASDKEYVAESDVVNRIIIAAVALVLFAPIVVARFHVCRYGRRSQRNSAFEKWRMRGGYGHGMDVSEI